MADAKPKKFPILDFWSSSLFIGYISMVVYCCVAVYKIVPPLPTLMGLGLSIIMILKLQNYIINYPRCPECNSRRTEFNPINIYCISAPSHRCCDCSAMFDKIIHSSA